MSQSIIEHGYIEPWSAFKDRHRDPTATPLVRPIFHLLGSGVGDDVRVSDLLPAGQKVIHLFATEGIPGCPSCNVERRKVSIASLLGEALAAGAGTVVLFCRLPRRALLTELRALTDFHRVVRDRAIVTLDVSESASADDCPVLATVADRADLLMLAAELSAVEAWAWTKGVTVGAVNVTQERRISGVVCESALGWICPRCGGIERTESFENRFCHHQSLQVVLTQPLQQLPYVDSISKTVLKILEVPSLSLNRVLSSLTLRERLALGIVRIVNAGVRGVSLYLDSIEQLYPEDGVQRLAEIARRISSLGITVQHEEQRSGERVTRTRICAPRSVRASTRWISLAMNGSDAEFTWELEGKAQVLELPDDNEVALWATEMILKGSSDRGALVVPPGTALTVVPSGLGKPPRWETLSAAVGLDSALGRVFVGSRLARQRGLTLTDFDTSRTRSRCEECGGVILLDEHVPCATCSGQGLSRRAGECLYGSVSLGELRGMTVSMVRDRLWREGEVAQLCDILLELGFGALPLKTPVVSCDPASVDMMRWVERLHRPSSRAVRQVLVGIYAPIFVSTRRAQAFRAVCEAHRAENSILCFFE